MPKVSIIVPTYNYAHLIGETLAGIRAQTLTDWQCLIVDDGSADNTAAVVAAIAARDSRFVFIARQHQGPSFARNAGLQHSQGEYIQFLDSDDILESSKLEKQAAFLDAHPEVDIVYGDVRYFRDDARQERTLSWDGGNHAWTQRLDASGAAAIGPLLRSNITTIHTPLFRRSLIEKVTGFDEKMGDAEDWDFWLRSALAGAHFHYEAWPDTLALVRSHRGSTSRNRSRMLQAEIYMRRKVNAELDAELRAINQAALKNAEFRLRLEQAMQEPSAFRRFRRWLQAGVGNGDARGLAYALAFALARSPILKEKASYWRDKFRRRKPD